MARDVGFCAARRVARRSAVPVVPRLITARPRLPFAMAKLRHQSAPRNARCYTFPIAFMTTNVQPVGQTGAGCPSGIFFRFRLKITWLSRRSFSNKPPPVGTANLPLVVSAGGFLLLRRCSRDSSPPIPSTACRTASEPRLSLSGLAFADHSRGIAASFLHPLVDPVE